MSRGHGVWAEASHPDAGQIRSNSIGSSSGTAAVIHYSCLSWNLISSHVLLAARATATAQPFAHLCIVLWAGRPPAHRLGGEANRVAQRVWWVRSRCNVLLVIRGRSLCNYSISDMGLHGSMAPAPHVSPHYRHLSQDPPCSSTRVRDGLHCNPD